MFGNLLLKKKAGQTLDALVRELSEGLSGAHFEERQSSNYLEERYFRASILGVAIEVALADEAEFPEFDFRVCFQPDGIHVDDKSFFDGLADCAARKLALLGHHVARPLNYGRTEGGAILYRANESKDSGLRERVTTEAM
jgi:hypothetical protein